MASVPARSRFTVMPQIPFPSMTAPIYSGGKAAAIMNTVPWPAPEARPRKNNTVRASAKPVPPPILQTRGSTSMTMAHPKKPGTTLYEKVMF